MRCICCFLPLQHKSTKACGREINILYHTDGTFHKDWLKNGLCAQRMGPRTACTRINHSISGNHSLHRFLWAGTTKRCVTVSVWRVTVPFFSKSRLNHASNKSGALKRLRLNNEAALHGDWCSRLQRTHAASPIHARGWKVKGAPLKRRKKGKNGSLEGSETSDFLSNWGCDKWALTDGIKDLSYSDGNKRI